MSESSSSSSGIGLTGVLFVVFLVLKLVGVIHWSWWWVTAPLWGGFALWIVFMVVVFAVTLAAHAGYKAGRR